MLIEDIEYVIFRHPDPAQRASSCWTMACWISSRRRDRLYLRSYGDAPFSYVTTKATPPFSAWVSASPTARRSRHWRPGSIRRLTNVPASRRRPVCGRQRSRWPAAGVCVRRRTARARSFDGARSSGTTPCQEPSWPFPAPWLWRFACAASRPCGRFHDRPPAAHRLVLREPWDEAFRTDPYMGDEAMFWPRSCTSTEATPGPTITRWRSSAPRTAGLDHVSFECRDFDDVGMGHMFDGRQGLQASLGHWPPFPRQPGLRLLDRSGRASMSSISSTATSSTATRQL